MKTEKSLCESCSNRVVAKYHNREQQYIKRYCFFDIVQNHWDAAKCIMILDSIVDDCSFYNKNFIQIRKNNDTNEDTDEDGDSSSGINSGKGKSSNPRHQARCGNME